MKKSNEWLLTAAFIGILGLLAFLCNRIPIEISEGAKYFETEKRAQRLVFEMRNRYAKDKLKIEARYLEDAFDAWGNPFEFRYQDDGRAEIRSAAKDRKIDTNDDYVMTFRYK